MVADRFQVIPLFVTALLVPFLTVVLQVVRQDEKPHHRLDPKTATKYIFAAMWTPVIMLLLGGFTIAAALSKFHIAKMMATFVLSKAGTRPRTVLITNMFVAMILSMWISNVASPVLCFSIIQVRLPLLLAPQEVLIHYLATSPQSTFGLQFFQSPHPRHRSCLQHWRRCLPNRFTAKYHRPPKHAAPAQLGCLVLCRPPRLHHLHSPDMGTPPHHLPARKRHHHRANTAYEGQVHRRTMVH